MVILIPWLQGRSVHLLWYCFVFSAGGGGGGC